MKKNDIVEIEITALSSECSGIGKKDGMVIFVPFSAIGDKLEVKILKVNKTYCYGKIERIITPSPDRVTPDCPVYTRCGGCSLRHISYEAQLRAKEQFVKDAFTRIGGLSPEFLPIIRNTNINGYRNKLQIPIGTDKDGNLIAGFYAFHSHRIVPCEKCLLQPDIFSKITADFLKISTGLNLTAYDETTHKGILRHLYLRKGYYSGEICLCIVVAKNVPEIKILSDRLLEKYPEIVSSVINVNNRDTNVILGDEEIVLTSKNYICDIMCKNAVNIAPKAFYQVNTPCAEQLYSSACDFAEPKGKTVLDLYCGAGTIGLSMARTAKKIIGVEIVPEVVLKKLSESLDPQNSVVVTEVGQHQMWAAQSVDREAPRSFLSSGGLGTMGFGFPAAIGAAIGCPEKQVVCVAGDGSFQMNSQEMATASIHRVPVKVLILDNRCLGMVHQWQKLFYDERYSSTLLDASPDFVKLAEAYGWQGERVEKPADVDAALARMLASDGPYLLDVAISRDQNVYPMVAPGRALDEVIGAIDVAVGAVRTDVPEGDEADGSDEEGSDR